MSPKSAHRPVGISSVSMMPYLYYPYLLGLCVIGSILLEGKQIKKKAD
ncbi:MAG: hypothetical protein IJ230_05585 [Clostridia bacterium]|nr:hypothetical protein [Clostridia bacterium]